MKSSARIPLIVLAAFLIFFGSGFTASQQNHIEREDVTSTSRPIAFSASNDAVFFNPLAIPELKPPVSPTMVIQPVNAADGIEIAPDPRFDQNLNPHRKYFIPASEQRPPELSESIPIVDNRPANRYDMNEWEQDRLFSSNLFLDTSYYNNWVDGNKDLSSKNEGFFYDENIRYELFSSRNDGDSISLTVDGTYTNDKRPYNDGFLMNQVTLDSRTQRSRLVFGHAFPEMSQYSMTHGMLGFYGTQDFEHTKVGGFAGYYALEKDDLKNPRYVAGTRIEHSRDDSLKIGFNVVGTEDERDNAGANSELPELANRVYSMDINIRPTENIFVNAEIAQSDTDFDKRDEVGELKGDAYRFVSGYTRENFQVEAGIEQADTSFLSPLGETPRDERSYFARFYYELNQYISARLSQRTSKDNLDNYQRSTIVRDQPEIQLLLKPSEYYKDLRIDFYYQPLHEYSENSTFMNRYIDLLLMEINHKAGEMRYFAGLSQTIDKDDVNVLNDRDIQRFDFNLTWEYDNFRQVYSSFSIEKLSYKRAGGMDQSRFYGFGGISRFHDDISIAMDFRREESDPTTTSFDSTHDRLNLSLTKEYSRSTRMIIDLEGSNNQFTDKTRDFRDYTAKLRVLRKF